MKRIILFLSLSTLFCMAASNSSGQSPVKNYEKEWKTVQALIDKRLPASALTEVKKIYTLAKKEKQEAQVIKSVAYRLMLQSENREDNDIAAIKEVETEIKTATQPAKSILTSLLGDLYLGYFQEHRWNLYSRTSTSYAPDDLATWSADQLHAKIGSLYLESLRESSLLQNTRLPEFEAIINKGNMRHLRPTMYDLLAHRALDYFKNDERSVTKPAYAFEINTASAFDPAADFIHRKFDTKDSASLQHKALLLFQQLIAFHLKDVSPDALIDADLERIQFVYSNSVHPDKETYYFNAVNHIAHQYENTPAAAQAWYLVAAFHEKNAATYSPLGDTTYRMDRLKARGILEKIMVQKDSSEGKVNAINLLNTINAPSFSFELEKVNVPGQPFRTLVSYRNLARLNLRIVKADAGLKAKLKDIYNEKSWPAIVNAPALKSWEQALPLTNDLQEHKVEIKIDGLPAGEYFLLAANGEKMADTKVMVGARLFYVSSISFVNQSENYFVLDRDNGQPLAAASVQAWEEKYNYDTYKYSTVKAGLYKTDANGYFKLATAAKTEKGYYRNNNIKLEISYNKEKLFMDESISNTYYNRYDDDQEVPEQPKVFLFMDRGIYRPGQTIYYKGMVLQKKKGNRESQILTGFKTIVQLQDANGEVVDSAAVTTNDYGSFNGKFTLPASGLTGSFSLNIEATGSSTSFQVEEYKRPKFEVSFEPLKGTYKVNDKITVTGIAKAYAGNAIDGATATWRVVRQPRFIYPWLYRGWLPVTAPLEIAHGDVKTDANGKFDISFDAIPDLGVNTKLDPVFDYELTVDVTDGAGETRSANQTVTAGYKSLFLKNSIPASQPLDSLKALAIWAENSNGQLQPTTARVTITRLQSEKRLIRKRLWERADQFVMGKEMYTQAFPYDEYDQESDPTTWRKLDKVFEQTDSIRASVPFSLGKTKFAAGWYLVEMVTNDKDGKEVKDLKYIELVDEKQNNPTDYLWTEGSRSIQPGEKTTVKLGTGADKLFVVQQVERLSPDSANGKPVSAFSYFTMTRGRRVIDVNAEEKDRGGFGMSWVFVKNNRIYSYSQTINVPWDNKNLKVEYVSFRDKTLPGSEEKWKLKISGNKNEAVAAEMLASMYDASLDQFYPFNWNQPSIWNYYSATGYWNGGINFQAVNSTERPLQGETYRRLDKQYDELAFGLNRYSDLARSVGGSRLYKTAAMAAPSAARGEEVMREFNLSGAYDMNKIVTDSVMVSGQAMMPKPAGVPEAGISQPTSPDPVQIRKNFNETAFFFPDLRTDKDGNIEFSFTLPDALTRWKFQALAHTKDLSMGITSKEIITQKQLMVQPNPTRFLRQGDKMEFSSKVVNMTDKEMTGMATLQLFDALTNEPVDGRFMNVIPQQFFTVAAGQSETLRFPMEIPFQYDDALVWRIVAKAGDYSDGEENTLPVLTNRTLVTESLPLTTKGAGSVDFKFDKLLNSGNSETLTHQSITVEYTSNPVWLAVQALPYLMEYPYDCAEQTWNRYYANALATMLANSSPK
ncbi:MAG: alpha-2-macroglobulin, partial [Chitinophagaceae bacterium]